MQTVELSIDLYEKLLDYLADRAIISTPARRLKQRLEAEVKQNQTHGGLGDK